MGEIYYRRATQQDLDFVAKVYAENIEALHGVPRTPEIWKSLLSQADVTYYIVYTDAPVGWFRLDREEDGLWLGMLQVKPSRQRRGIGRAAVAAAEGIARQWGFCSLGIHTTQDNLPAWTLYAACGYTLTEIGPCTTADGVQRVGCTLRKDL